MRVAILGAGAFGTACAAVLAGQEDHDVRLHCRRSEQAERLTDTRENTDHLPGIVLPDRLTVTADMAEAVHQAHIVFVAIPTVHLRQGLSQARGLLESTVPVVSLAKGLEQQTLLRPSEIVREVLGPRSLAVIGGPCHAEELARGRPASVVVASPDDDLLKCLQSILRTQWFRPYTDHDVVGCELAGALKNVIAIGAGACDGLELGDNAKAALVARGLAELVRFGEAHGGQRRTFYGLAGVGDLFTTCNSRHSRNRGLGERLGRGETPEQILSSSRSVPEGASTCRAVRQRGRQLGLDLPITEEVCQVLFEGKSAAKSVGDLMLRSPKSEWPD